MVNMNCRNYLASTEMRDVMYDGMERKEENTSNIFLR
jgi:hypothetical protein